MLIRKKALVMAAAALTVIILLLANTQQVSAISQGEEGTTEDGFTYVVSKWDDARQNGEARIKGYIGNLPDVVIPSAITLRDQDGEHKLPVVAIDRDAFKGNIRLKSVEIPDTVKSIGESAFRDCINLVKVKLGTGLEEICDRAFKNCVKLPAIELKEGLKTIGKEAFYNCRSLVGELKLPETLAEVGAGAFNKCKGLVGKLILPSSLKKAGLLAFGNRQFTVVVNKSATAFNHTAFLLTGEGSLSFFFDARGHRIEVLKKGTFKLTVTRPESLKDGTVKLKKASYTYNGKVHKPSVTVKLNGKTLKSGTDYTVRYSDAKSKAAGTYKVIVSGKGAYKDTNSALYKIRKAGNTLKVKGKTATVRFTALKAKSQVIKAGKAFAVSKAKGKLSYSKSSGDKKITVDRKSGKITVKRGLAAKNYSVKVKVTAAGNQNYRKAAKTVTVKIAVK